MPIDRWIYKQNVVERLMEYLFNLKKEWNSDTHDVDEPWRYHAMWIMK